VPVLCSAVLRSSGSLCGYSLLGGLARLRRTLRFLLRLFFTPSRLNRPTFKIVLATVRPLCFTHYAFIRGKKTDPTTISDRGLENKAATWLSKKAGEDAVVTEKTDATANLNNKSFKAG